MSLRAWLVLYYAVCAAHAQTLNLPPRATNAPTGSELIQRLTPLGLEAREQEIFAQISSGNVPDFLHRFCPVAITNVTGGKTNSAQFFVLPDYLAVGTDADYFLTPLTAVTAQRIADLAGCSLPTRKMVDAIYAAAELKLSPSPIPPSPAMTTLPVFAAHNSVVRTQRAGFLKSSPLGAVVAGHKKDVVISAKLAQSPDKVAIYGWHRLNGVVIQPLYIGHAASWADYSHGIRLVNQTVQINGQPRHLGEVLGDSTLASLLSDEGPLADPRYATNSIQRLPAAVNARSGSMAKTNFTLADFKSSPHFDEQILSFIIEPGVKIHINAPGLEQPATNHELLLAFYALPNGNTTAQTMGKVLQPGDDWHFDIQHIAAQTRFVRRALPGRTLAVAYLEADSKSWPAWRKQHGDAQIPGIIAAVTRMFAAHRVQLAFTSHSGGGSFIFGYLNAVRDIPDEVQRIAFLDSNYAYDAALGHADKLLRWLRRSGDHHLYVLAYNDAVALLDGKPFVSAAGGTWGRSHAMLRDLSAELPFVAATNAPSHEWSALNGRVQFLLRENRERKVLHTVQVERNGFIHALLSGTPGENGGYEYFGARAYGAFVAPD